MTARARRRGPCPPHPRQARWRLCSAAEPFRFPTSLSTFARRVAAVRTPFRICISRFVGHLTTTTFASRTAASVAAPVAPVWGLALVVLPLVMVAMTVPPPPTTLLELVQERGLGLGLELGLGLGLCGWDWDWDWVCGVRDGTRSGAGTGTGTGTWLPSHSLSPSVPDSQPRPHSQPASQSRSQSQFQYTPLLLNRLAWPMYVPPW